ncbi:MAG: hypothetical protein IT348_13785 [Candidatus Eisenbacteria bacterium]|nr:hypothetical protein [Candidatus Eisenbacteria bacterium]
MARKFFFVSAGMFLLALAYHLGASTATADGPLNPVTGLMPGGPGTGDSVTVVTADGDLYGALSTLGPFVYRSNVFVDPTRPEKPRQPRSISEPTR